MARRGRPDDGLHSADGKVDYQDTLIVSVKNVAPILPAGTNTTITEGSTFARNVSFTDPGADVWTAMVNYGDGPAAVVLTGLASGSPIALDHRYFDDGQFTVLVTLTDGDGGTATQSFIVTVTNVAPTVNAGADRQVAEGTPVTLVGATSDPGGNALLTFLWPVVASNGQVIPAGQGSTFTFTPTDDGTYTVTVTVQDEDLATGTDQIVITATNVSPDVNWIGPETLERAVPMSSSCWMLLIRALTM